MLGRRTRFCNPVTSCDGRSWGSTGSSSASRAASRHEDSKEYLTDDHDVGVSVEDCSMLSLHFF